MTKEKTIGQIRLALNHKEVQKLIKELKKHGHDVAFEVYHDIMFSLIEQVYDRGTGGDKPIVIKTRGIKY